MKEHVHVYKTANAANTPTRKKKANSKYNKNYNK